VREVFEEKAKIRRVIEAEGVPYTYLCCHAFTGYFLRNLAQIDITVPPRDKIYIQGDGNVKGSVISCVNQRVIIIVLVHTECKKLRHNTTELV